jgi:predicted N-formylglutamate amidohydrolase
VNCLFDEHEPHPVSVERVHGRSPFLLTCDHASNRIPESLGTLGLAAADLQRHIAWDIGAAEVSRHLAEQLDATLVVQNYSRLVVDCNRPRESDQLIPLKSERTVIPGNQTLSEGAREQRHTEIFVPYHDAITELLDRREPGGRTVFVAIHSFTPVYLDDERPWHIGVLFNDDSRMGEPMLEQLRAEDGLCVGENEPYRLDHNDYGIPVHGEGRGIPHVLIEIRQDLITSKRGQQDWASRLAVHLTDALTTL